MLLIPKELAGSGRFQGDGILVMMTQRFYGTTYETVSWSEIHDSVTCVIFLYFPYGYLVGIHVWGGFLPSCCCKFVSNEQPTCMFAVSFL